MQDLNWKELEILNFYPKASEQFKAGHFVDKDTGLVTSHKTPSWDPPWDYVQNDPQRNVMCSRMHFIFETYNLIPPFCQECWKVVVRPTTLRELFKLRDLQRQMAKEDPQCWCKCGIEVRMYAPGLYGGYFYNNGRAAGEEKYIWVRKAVDEQIGQHVGVVLKRYCTEFEKELGDSAEYEPPPHCQDIQNFIMTTFEEGEPIKQPGIVKMNVYHSWIKFGWKFGTPQDRREIENDWNHGEPLYPLPRKYNK